MALSGTQSFKMTADEIIRKAAQRAGGGLLTGEELKDARFSLNLVFRNILNSDPPLSLIQQYSLTYISGQSSYDIPCIIDVHHSVIKEGTTGSDLQMKRVSLAEFNSLPNKTQTGRPTVFTTERKWNKVTVRVWPVPSKTYTGTMYVIYKPDDVTKYTDDIELQPRIYPALIAGLAFEMAMDRPTTTSDRIKILAADYEAKLEAAMSEDRERTSYMVRPQLSTR